MNINKLAEEIYELIAKDDFLSAIGLLHRLLKKSPKLDEIIVQSARYSDLSKQIRLGVVDFEQANITKNKIRYAIIDLVKEIQTTLESNKIIKNEIECLPEDQEGSRMIILNLKAKGDIEIDADQGNSVVDFREIESKKGKIKIDIKQK